MKNFIEFYLTSLGFVSLMAAGVFLCVSPFMLRGWGLLLIVFLAPIYIWVSLWFTAWVERKELGKKL